MKRLLLAFVLVTGLEFFAFSVFRAHPIHRPGYFSGLLTVIQFLMCYGGIESARWLLRRSPAARAPGPHSDWARLWVWLGPPGGALMVMTSLLAWLAAGQTPSWLPPALLLGHAAGGGVLWMCASLDMLPSLAQLPASARRLNGTLAGLGLMTHLSGLYCYARLYPAGQLKVGLLALAVLLAYFVFYYIWAACLCWSLIFRFWTPPQESDEQDPHGLEPEQA